MTGATESQKELMKQVKMTVKQWKRWDDEQQEQILKKYDIILTNHKTRRERFIGIMENIDITSRKGRKNLNRALDKMDRGFETFDKYNKQLFSDEPKKYKAITG